MILGALLPLGRHGDKMLIAQRRELEALQADQAAFQKADQTRKGKPRAEAGAPVDSVRQAAAQALSDLTRISKGLFLKESDAQNGLCGSLRRIIDAHEKRSGSQVECRGIDSLPELPAQTLLCAAQLLREALTNAQKHAHGAKQRVEAEVSNGKLLLTVAEQRPGMGAEIQAGQSSGLGLHGMRYHVEALGRTMVLVSAPGKGTQLRFVVPLRPEPGIRPETRIAPAADGGSA